MARIRINIGHHQRGTGQYPEFIQRNQDFDPDKRADSEDFTVGKVNKFQDTIHHGVPQGNGGIDKADRQSIYHHLGQVDKGIGKERHIQTFEKCLSDHGPVQNQGENQYNG